MHLESTTTSTSDIVLEVESRNFNRTVGTTLFSKFASTFDPTTDVITFTANSAFELAANTSYCLVLSDSRTNEVKWDFTASNVYQSQFGYGLPSTDTSWSPNADNGRGNATYY
jgi:hypothetical protein